MKNTIQKTVAGFAVVLSLVILTACGGGCSVCGLDPGHTYVAQYDSIHYELVADDSGCIIFNSGGTQCDQFQVGPVV